MGGKEIVKEAGSNKGAMGKSAAVKESMYIVTAAELNRNMSFEFNCRAPSRASRAYRSMRETLAEQPERFLYLNGGITVANGKYILDGGHTYMAIMDAIREDQVDAKRVQVRVVDLGELSDAEMGKRSIALNRRVTPPLVGERDLEGAWNKIKSTLSSKYAKLYEFRPNTAPEAKYKVDFLVALLHAWSVKQADRSYSGKGQLVRLYNDDKYSKQLPLLNKAIEVYSAVYKVLVGEKKLTSKVSGYRDDVVVVLPNGEEVDGYLPEAYVWPVFGAFESLIDKSGEFTREPEELLMARKDKIVKQILTDYRRCGSNPGQYGKDGTSYLNATIALMAAN